MKQYLLFFTSHKIYTALILISIAFLFTSFIVISTHYGEISHSLLLQFNTLKGANIFTEKSSLWGIWLLGLTIMAIHGVLMYEFWNRERFLSYLFAFTGTFFSLLVFIIIVSLVANN